MTFKYFKKVLKTLTINLTVTNESKNNNTFIFLHCWKYTQPQRCILLMKLDMKHIRMAYNNAFNSSGN